jgi:hypothetical protein
MSGTMPTGCGPGDGCMACRIPPPTTRIAARTPGRPRRIDPLRSTRRPWAWSNAPGSLFRSSKIYSKKVGRVPTLEVHGVRHARRVVQRGLTRTDLVIEMTQRRRGYLDPEKQARIDAVREGDAFLDCRADHWKTVDKPDFIFRGGCTLLIDGETGKVRYCIRKDILSTHERRAFPKAVVDDGHSRLARQREFARDSFAPTLRATYDPETGSAAVSEPFAMLHRSF